jgi:polyisoprenoid-binding protein YceI
MSAPDATFNKAKKNAKKKNKGVLIGKLCIKGQPKP